jgi:hypothetical protein
LLTLPGLALNSLCDCWVAGVIDVFTILGFTCFINQLTARLAAVSYVPLKKLASHLSAGAICYYPWPICCIWSWSNRTITVCHISKATMQLSQFSPKVSQFNETN